jgi:hypothetical protein
MTAVTSAFPYGISYGEKKKYHRKYSINCDMVKADRAFTEYKGVLYLMNYADYTNPPRTDDVRASVRAIFEAEVPVGSEEKKS